MSFQHFAVFLVLLPASEFATALSTHRLSTRLNRAIRTPLNVQQRAQRTALSGKKDRKGAEESASGGGGGGDVPLDPAAVVMAAAFGTGQPSDDGDGGASVVDAAASVGGYELSAEGQAGSVPGLNNPLVSSWAAEEFKSDLKHRDFLHSMSALPNGFRVGTSQLSFDPVEDPSRADLPMRLTLLLLDEPTDAWAAMFTSNAFPGSPVKVGRRRVQGGTPLKAILINNKISNVCCGGPPGAGEQASEALCLGLGALMSIADGDSSPEAAAAAAATVLPCSTGIIGWSLPVKRMLQALPACLQSANNDGFDAFEASKAIMTTDRFPKLRAFNGGRGDEAGGSGEADADEQAGGGGGGGASSEYEVMPPHAYRLVGFAKGAGMIEPHLATMLVYVLTDLDLDRQTLDAMLRRCVAKSFNCISVDSDESTSDTVVIVSSRKVACPAGLGLEEEFEAGLLSICQGLADDVVRNGEGTDHVIKVEVTGGTCDQMALELGRAVVNSPLLKCAVAGNDPNVGRLVAAVGKFVGDHYAREAKAGHTKNGMPPEGALDRCELRMGGKVIFADGQFRLSGDTEQELIQHMKAAELGDHGKSTYPAHKRTVDVEIRLGLGAGSATVLGSDLTHEYVTVNADYRS